jgi:transcriptional regulator with XRE-family HTH domain
MDKQNFIKMARISLNMTQEEFAEAVGVTRVTINALELGKRSPKKAMLAIIEQLLQSNGSINEPWTSDELELLHKFRKLPLHHKAHILGIIQGLGDGKPES